MAASQLVGPASEPDGGTGGRYFVVAAAGSCCWHDLLARARSPNSAFGPEVQQHSRERMVPGQGVLSVKLVSGE